MVASLKPKASEKIRRRPQAPGSRKRQDDDANLLKKWDEKRRRRLHLDPYGDPIADQRDPVDLGRLSDDLRRVGNLTHDQIFSDARLALSAHGLGIGKKGVAKRYRGVSLDYEIALRWMDRLIDEHKAKGEPLSIRLAAKKAAAEYGVGPSLEAAAKKLRNLFPRFDPAASSRTTTTGRKIWVMPVEDKYTGPVKLPARGKQVIDSPLWRLLFYAGRVSVRILA